MQLRISGSNEKLNSGYTPLAKICLNFKTITFIILNRVFYSFFQIFTGTPRSPNTSKISDYTFLPVHPGLPIRVKIHISIFYR